MPALRHLWWAPVLILLFAAVALAQNLPALTGRVVDQAELLSPQQEGQLTAKLETLERNTSRQLVVVTVPDLQGQAVEDFAFALGEQWKIGNKEADNGAILLVAVADKRIRIEVGDGIEGILPDALAYFIIRDRMTPRFKQNDYPGGIAAGVDGIVEQLQAPLEVAEQRAVEATNRRRQQVRQSGGSGGGGSGSLLPLIFWGVIIVFILLPALFGRRGRGRTYRRGGWGMGPVVIWGGGGGGGWGGGGFGGGGGGFGGGFGGGGGFSGGGGSFGGGGASGSW